MMFARALSIGFAVTAVSCSGGDDSVLSSAGSGGDSGDTSSSAATSTATSGEGGAGGSAPLDPEATCNAYCTSWLACDDTYPTVGACEADCIDDVNSAALGGVACFESYQRLLQCITALSCEELPNWSDQDGPCAAALEAAASDC